MSITPLGEWGRGRRYAPTLIAFLMGSIVGGAAVGAAAGFAGSVVLHALKVGVDVRLATFAAVLGGGLMIDLTGRGDRLPGPVRQVNERWLDRYRGWVYGLGFGVQLGLGVVTIVTTAMVYVMVAATFLTASASAGFAIGAVFGATRGATVLPARRVRDPGELARVSARLGSLALPAVHLTAAVEGAALVFATVVVAS